MEGTPFTIQDLTDLGWKFTRQYTSMHDEVMHFERGISYTHSQGWLEYRPKINVLKISTTDDGYTADGPAASVKYHGKCYTLGFLKELHTNLMIR